MYKVEYYQLPNGKVPVEEFIDRLPGKLREKTFHSLLLLEEYGPALEKAESKYIRDGVFELRTRFGTDITRVFYFFYAGQRVVVTNGFIKKTQKTPRGEIARALRYKHDWEVRNNAAHT